MAQSPPIPRPPVISQQPQGTNVAVGQTATLTVGVGPSILATTYRWEFTVSTNPASSWTLLAGATNAVLSLTNIQPANAGFYRALVSNAMGQRESDPARLGVLGLNVVDLIAPSVSRGANVTLRATTYHIPLPEYRWSFKGMSLSGAQDSRLVLTNVTASAAGGTYRVIVSSTSGGTAAAELTLHVDETFTKITQGAYVENTQTSTGPSFGDVDNDGDLDLITVDRINGYALLYANQGELADWPLTLWKSYPCDVGASWGDFDNDGLLDLCLTSWASGAALYRNLGSGSYLSHGTVGRAVGANWTWIDYDNDGRLDGFCNRYNAPSNLLMRNVEGGTFEPALPSAIVTNIAAANPGNGSAYANIGPAWSDYDNDGYLDLIVGHRGTATPPWLYHNSRDGTFTRETNSPIALSRLWSSAHAWGDYDNDGDPDLFMGSCGGTGNPANSQLFRNEGAGSFGELTNAVDFPMVDEGGYARAAVWGDYDNDGFLDLFALNAGYSGAFDVIMGWFSTSSFLYHNDGDGTFTKVASGSIVNDLYIGGGASWADYNNDGFLDLFVATHPAGGGSQPRELIYRNNANSNGWLVVGLRGTNSSSYGVGAKVRVTAHYAGADRSQMREILGGDGTLTGPPLYAHFGLGDATNVTTLRIEWPSGIVQEYADLSTRQFLTLQEPAIVPALTAATLTLTNLGPTNLYRVELSNRVEFAVAEDPRLTSYQWQKDGQDIPGANAATYVIAEAAGRDVGNYTLRVTGLDPDLGTFTATYPNTNRVLRLELEGAPAFVWGPRVYDRSTSLNVLLTFPSVSLGADLSLQVSVAGTAPMLYQWQHDGVDIANIPSATNRYLALTNVQSSDRGNYRLRVWNDRGTNVSSEVHLNVDPTFEMILDDPLTLDGVSNRAGSWGDYDNDGNVDVFSARPDGRPVIYRNRGTGSFDVSAETTALLAGSVGGSWGDFNNDGLLDLFSPQSGAGTYSGSIYRNTGGKPWFELLPANVVGALASRALTRGVWADYDNDGFLDLMGLCGFRTATSPAGPNLLFRGDGTGRFLEATNSPTVNAVAFSLGAAWGDYDADGFLDLLVGDWRAGTRPLLYHNEAGLAGERRLVRITNGAIAEVQAPTVAGSWADYDNDGFLDLFVANADAPSDVAAAGGGDFLFHNSGNGSFTRVTEGVVIGEGGGLSAGAWGDYDNDGFLDLFVFRRAFIGTAGGDSANYPTNSSLFRNTGDGAFAKVTTGSPVNIKSGTFFGSWVDYDNDGFLDLHVATDGNDLLFRNTGRLHGNTNAWMVVSLRGTNSNRYGVGARVRVLAHYRERDWWQLREITNGDGYDSGRPLVAHFGLGDATNVTTLRIEWPSRIVQEFHNVAVNQLLVGTNAIEEPFLTVTCTNELTDGALLLDPGDTVTLVASPTNLVGATYQWLFNGQALTGQTNATLVRTIASTNDVGSYTVVVSNGTSTETGLVSGPAKALTVDFSGKPQFTSQPRFTTPARGLLQPVSVSLNAPVEITVTATGEGPLFYQWQRDGVDIDPALNASATNRSLSLGAVTLADAGSYRVAVWSERGSTVSSNVVLAVDPTFTKVTSGELVQTPSAVDSGVSAFWGDYDDDGLVDVLVNITDKNVPATGLVTNYLYHNEGDFVFHRVSPDPFGIANLTAISAAWADFDHDRDLDLLWNVDYRTVVCRNDGAAGFTRLPAIADGTANGIIGTTASWVDYDNDGRLDVFLGRATGSSAPRNLLLHNELDGSFTPAVTGPLATHSGHALGTVWADYDGDGWLDVVVSYYPSPSTLYRNEGGGAFSNVSPNPLAGTDYGTPIFADYDNDGDFDLFVKEGAVKSMAVIVNQGDGTFSSRTNLLSFSKSGLWFGLDWGDYDNDGWLDLVGTSDSGPCIFRNHGDGTFTELINAGPAADRVHCDWCSWVDLDADGFLDLFVGTGGAAGTPQRLHRNNGNTNHWLVVKPIGTVSSGTPVGAKVRVQAVLKPELDPDPTWQLRQISATGSDNASYGQGEIAHFGLGDATNVTTLRIEWPSGIVQEYADVSTRQFLTLQEPAIVPALTAATLTLTNLGPTNLYRVELSNRVEFAVAEDPRLTSYQWQKDGQDIPGANAATYVIAEAAGRDVGNYTLRVTGLDPDLGTFTAVYPNTNRVLRLELEGAPVVTSGPLAYYVQADTTLTRLSVPVSPGSNVRITAGFTGTAPFSLQWEHDGEAILDNSSATRTVLTLTKVQVSDRGTYRLRITNSVGSIVSAGVQLDVDPTFTMLVPRPVVTEGLDGWGSAWGDYDADGDLDLVVVGGFNEVPLVPVTLYTNRGDGVLSVAQVQGVAGSGAHGWAVNWVDIENDGDLDFWIGNQQASPPALFVNKGGTAFERIFVNEQWLGTDLQVRGAAQAWADYNNDGYADLAVIPVGDWASARGMRLLQNDGTGHLSVVSNALGLSKYSATVSWIDHDGDGDMDLFTSGNEPNLYRNDRGILVAEYLGLPTMRSLAWADFDNDGDFDVFLSQWGDILNVLCENDGSGHFTVITNTAVAALRQGLYCNAAAWGDYDNDGHLDLFVAAGAYGSQDRNYLYHADGAGGFTEAYGSPAIDLGCSTSCSWADYNNDGFLDLFVVNGNNDRTTTSDFLYRNSGNSNSWLEVGLKGRLSNRSAIGAKVRVLARIGARTFWQARMISAQSDAQELITHFGLGDATNVTTLRIEWPSGIGQEFHNVAVNQLFIGTNAIEEPFLTVTCTNELTDGALLLNPGDVVTLVASPTNLVGAAYQWFFNGQALAGQTNQMLFWTIASINDVGSYTVVVSNGTSTESGVVSGPAKALTVDFSGKPQFTSQPRFTTPARGLLQPVSVSLNAPVVITAFAGGTGTRFYQWQRDGVDLDPALNPSATSNRLSIVGVTLADAGSYRVVVWSERGSTVSSNVVLAVDPTFTKITEGSIVTDVGVSRPGSWFDYDRDGDLDLVVGGAPPARFYRNDGQDFFIRLTTNELGALPESGDGPVADFNNDGWLDVFGRGKLYRNDQGRFSRASVEEEGDLVTVGVAPLIHGSADYDNDGHLDLFAINNPNPPPNQLFRNQRGGHFVSVTNTLTTYVRRSWSIGGSWGDFDNDGDSDIFVGALGGAPRMFFRNDGNGVFTGMTNSGVDLSSSPTLCGAWGDYDNDGWLDLFVPSWEPSARRDQLFRNNGDGTFTLALAGAVGSSTGIQARGAGWADFDNDGHLDLFVASWTGTTNRLYRNLGDGTFAAVTTGSPISDRGDWHGVAWGDYNRDGAVDLWVGWSASSGAGGTCALYRNNGNSNAWLLVQPVGKVSNSYGVGAHVRVKATLQGKEMWQLREITSGDGFSTTLPPEAHFGLGDATNVSTLRIEWPSGIVQEFTDVAPKQFLTIEEPLLKVFVNGEMNPTNAFSFDPNTPVTLSVPTNLAATSYQWQLNGTDIPGATDPALAIPAFVFDNVGRYNVRIAGSDPILGAFTGSLATNRVVQIDLAGLPQVKIVANPSYVPSLGVTVRLIASVSGTPPFTYQWLRESAPIDPIVNPSATNNLLTLRNVTLFNQAIYTVVVRNAIGSGQASYFLKLDPTFAKVNTGPIVAAVGGLKSGAWADYDRDGDLDLVVADAGPGYRPYVFRNQGNGVFVDASSVSWSGYDPRFITSVTWGDYDNNGTPDLFMSHYTYTGAPTGGDYLFKNSGGTMSPLFQPANAGTVTDYSGSGSTGAGWADYDNDGWLDLYVTQELWLWDAVEPRMPSRLYHNTGQGTFELMTNSLPMIAPALISGKAMSWADYDDDGWMDLLVATTWNGPGTYTNGCVLYHNLGHGKFEWITNTPLTQPGPASLYTRQIAWADIDNDGDLDLFISSATADWSPDFTVFTVTDINKSLFRNVGGGVLEPVTEGILANLPGYVQMGDWGDYDNDGNIDFFCAANPTTNLLYHNLGDWKFESLAVGNPTEDPVNRAGAVSWADYNGDGFLDLLLLYDGNSPQLYENRLGVGPNANHWLEVRCEGRGAPLSNRSGIGAKVRVWATIRGQEVQQYRPILSTPGGYANASPLLAHFGLGDATNVTALRIEWPSGIVQELSNVAANQILTVVEPLPNPVLFAPVLRPDGVFQFTVSGLPRTTHGIEVSANLVDWAPTGITVTGPTNLVEVPAEAAPTGRYYRVKGP